MSTKRQTAEDLGITKEQLAVAFAYAAECYRSPTRKIPLRGIAAEIFEVLMVETHTTPREYEDHNRKLAGRDASVVRGGIYTLEDRGVPVQRERTSESKGLYTIGYTRYYLTPEFKKAFVEKAEKWAQKQQGQKDSPTNARVLSRA